MNIFITKKIIFFTNYINFIQKHNQIFELIRTKMVSLYVCDVPQNIEKDELADIFSCFDGFIEVRIARDRNRQRIAFVDYTDQEKA